jgi:hypothetical protein
MVRRRGEADPSILLPRPPRRERVLRCTHSRRGLDYGFLTRQPIGERQSGDQHDSPHGWTSRAQESLRPRSGKNTDSPRLQVAAIKGSAPPQHRRGSAVSIAAIR